MILFHVNVPIFDMAVVFCGDCPAEEANNAFYDYEGTRAKIQFEDTNRGSVTDCNGDVYCWVKNTDWCSTIFHEMVHVAFSICEVKGMEPDEELIAYLVGWLKINVVERIQDERDVREAEGTEA